ncbi:MAG: hypothetical protein JWN86_2435 [Planctomycetota bacterium]|nr:hypothetical protein [Planctomycetota bacterium]
MIEDALQEIGRALEARAVGLWRFAGEAEGLVQVAFWPALDLPPDVAEGFAQATRRVAMRESGLGIVRAVLARRPFVSRAMELPPESGSGLWLRRFGADRSVAVPLMDAGHVIGVASVALPTDSLPESTIADAIGCLRAFLPERGRQ